MDARERLFYWLLTATKGGPTRLRLLASLSHAPKNARKLALDTQLDYKTVQHHLKLLYENGLVELQGRGYGKTYFVSEEYSAKNSFIEKLKRRST
ncbi:winged helix-turn-helix domain-containing protein [Candidatus Micrarchaeota archaeon]|nr:winged helix-turn-helix domain-containing protein [Candidatus Micrarchaeota archaeon]